MFRSSIAVWRAAGWDRRGPYIRRSSHYENIRYGRGTITCYLNNAATSWPKPDAVRHAVAGYLEGPPWHEGRGCGNSADGLPARCRTALAALLGTTHADRIVFASGATEALNLAILGSLDRGGHVVTTAAEHNSVLRPLHTLRDEGRITLDVVPCDARGLVAPADVISAFVAGTVLVAMTHCSNVTGTLQDVAPVCAAARERGIRTVVDASQSLGAVPLDVDAWQADLVAFTGHKGLFGMPGCGGLYLAPGADPRPLITGGTGGRSDLLTQPDAVPVRYEAGTPNLPGIASMLAGAAFVNDGGLRHNADAARERAAATARELAGIPGVRLQGGANMDGRLPVLSFTLDGMDTDDAGFMLEESFGVVCRAGLHCAPLVHGYLGTGPGGSVRASGSFLTGDAEWGRLVDAVRAMARAGGA